MCLGIIKNYERDPSQLISNPTPATLITIISSMPTKRPISSVSVFLNKTDGRDGLVKIIQFTALTVAFFASEQGLKDVAFRAGVLASVSKDTRRLMRLFKGIIEYNRLMAISGFVGQSLYHNTMILTRIFFILWMFFDNLAFLSEIHTFSSSPGPLNKLACIFWTAQLLMEGTNRASQLYMDVKSKASHRVRFPTLVLDSQISHSILKVRKLTTMIYESISKIIAISLNLVAALACTTVLEEVFGDNINDGVVGITSLVAAFIEVYHVYTGALTDNLT